MLATEYAEYYNIPKQREGESDAAFRSRVAGRLRSLGYLIEAHEAQADARYEDSDDVMTGIMGAVGMALQGRDYGGDGEHRVGDDIAAGHIVRHGRERTEKDSIMALLAVMLFGGR